jgi:hypothetical protein
MSSRIVRPIRVQGDVAFVELTRGAVATIDAADIHLVSSNNWCLQLLGGRQYAGHSQRGESRRLVLMHRVIFDAPGGMHIDHIDGDGLNNRRSNLRLASREGNMRNVGKTASNTSGYKGVHWCEGAKKWRCQIRTDGGRISLGLFDTPEAAYEAYRSAAMAHHGEYARLD